MAIGLIKPHEDRENRPLSAIPRMLRSSIEHYAFDDRTMIERLRSDNVTMVMIDWNVGYLDAASVTKELKSKHKDLSVIVFAKDNKASIRALFKKVGADGFVVVPFRASEVIKLVDQIATAKTTALDVGSS
jgi:DNA-binding response OmpR family regulator